MNDIREDIYRLSEQLAKKKKGGKQREMGGKKADAFHLRTCHISGTRRESGGRQDRGGGVGVGGGGVLLLNSKTFPNNSWPRLRHFSSFSGSEGAGWWCGQPLPNVDSQAQSKDV